MARKSDFSIASPDIKQAVDELNTKAISDDLTDEELSMKIKEFAGVPSPVSVIETPHMHTKKSIFSGHKKAKTNMSSNENLIRDESFNETYKK